MGFFFDNFGGWMIGWIEIEADLRDCYVQSKQVFVCLRELFVYAF